jgi:hypothetical protein
MNGASESFSQWLKAAWYAFDPVSSFTPAPLAARGTVRIAQAGADL